MIRRCSCFLLSLCFLLFLSYPVLATSSDVSSDVSYVQPVTASGSIGGTIALSGYLSASGIHLSAQGAAFSDVELELGNLWDLYRSAYQGVKNITDYTGSIVRGGYVLAKDAWNAFGGFARWLQNKFNLSDNQNNVNLSDTPVDTALLSTMYKTKVGDGYYRTSSSNRTFSNGYIQLSGVSNSSLYGFYQGPDSYSGYTVRIYNGSNNNVNLGADNVKIYINNTAYNAGPVYTTLTPGQSCETKVAIYGNFNTAFVKTTGTTISPSEPVEQSILSVDTSIIDIPEDIPDDATGSQSLGGVMIPAIGAGVGGAAGAVAGTIINGILGGDLIDDVIVPSSVSLPPGTTIGSGGDVLPDTLDINPSDVFLNSDSYSLPGLRDYFPFCIPFIVWGALTALSAEPVTPVFVFSFDMPDEIGDFSISVDLSPFDGVAQIMRSGLFLVFAIGWSLYLWQKLG